MLHDLIERFIEQWWPWIVAWVVVMVLLETLERYCDHHKALKRLRELAQWGPAVVCAALLSLIGCGDRGWWWLSLLFALWWSVGAEQSNARRLKLRLMQISGRASTRPRCSGRRMKARRKPLVTCHI